MADAPTLDVAVSPRKDDPSYSNEDYVWTDRQDGYTAVLVLDGTSGTDGDFGRTDEQSGGRRYVEAFAEGVAERFAADPGGSLEAMLQGAIAHAWDAFEPAGEEARDRYFETREGTLPRATTIPGAVGALVRWDDATLDVCHVGDVETYVETDEGIDAYANAVHQRFDAILDDYIAERREEEALDDPNADEDVRDLVSHHREAANFPGTYPNMSFNPLVVEKLGETATYDRDRVSRVLMGTDGASARMLDLLELSPTDLFEFVAEEGAEGAIRELRRTEEDVTVDALKSKDDAALAFASFR
jgi:hypothetical protein